MRRARGATPGAMITILNVGGVTQGQIAARTGIAQSTLRNYKRGVNTAARGRRPARRLSPAEGKRAAVIRESIAAAHLARGSVTEAARVAQSGLAIVRETEFAMRLPRFEDIARGLLRCQRQPQVRAYLEEFAMTKRQFAPSRAELTVHQALGFNDGQIDRPLHDAWKFPRVSVSFGCYHEAGPAVAGGGQVGTLHWSPGAVGIQARPSGVLQLR